MATLTNAEIRDAAKRNGVFLWQVAEGIGITDSTLSRKLRRELTDDERERVLNVIDKLAAQRREVS